jgi:ribosome maturation protein Sdo1
MMQPAAFSLRDLRYLRENIHIRVLTQFTNKKPQCLPQISLIYADKPQNHTNLTNCLSLRNNAACCIPLRDLRYLRENIHIRVLNQFTNKKPQCLPQISLITQTKPKTTTTSQTVFLCEIMQLAAFLCVICAICGRIFT